MAISEQKIIPNLWFDTQAEETANFYASTFGNSKVGDVTRATKAGFEVHHRPEGTVMTIEFELEGMRFIAINGGPLFKFNPSISFLVACQEAKEVDGLWSKLSRGTGTPLMDLGSYPFSERYGWIQDKYGLSDNARERAGNQTEDHSDADVHWPAEWQSRGGFQPLRVSFSQLIHRQHHALR